MGFDVSTAANIKLFDMMMPLDQVTFDLNPKTFTVTKKQDTSTPPHSGSGGTGAMPAPADAPAGYTSLYRGTKPTLIDFTALLSDEGRGTADAVADATVVGGGVKARCDLLLSWTQPGGGGSLAGAVVSAAASALGLRFQKTPRPKIVTLQWGDPARGFLMRGFVRSVKATYTRFDGDGNPSRAEVNVVFEEAPNPLLNLLTNPTSGGVPGRRVHVVTDGESLQAIATAAYGRPQAWRQVADANGIDDPLRVRPGDRVYLPSDAELAR